MSEADTVRQPPQTITIHWCPVCGRDNRSVPFTGKSHFSGGERCPGSPVLVEYMCKTLWRDWERA